MVYGGNNTITLVEKNREQKSKRQKIFLNNINVYKIVIQNEKNHHIAASSSEV